MAVAVEAAISAKLSIEESVDLTSVDAFNTTKLETGASKWSGSTKLSATTTPAAQDSASFVQALTAGAATIDLSALTGTNGRAVNGTGKKILAIFLKPLGANPMTFTAGASNGYLLFGASGSVAVPNGGFLLKGFGSALSAIDGTHKTIDVAGTGSQTCQVQILFGL